MGCKRNAVVAAINTWRMRSKQGIMIGSELLICYSLSGRFSVGGCSQLKPRVSGGQALSDPSERSEAASVRREESMPWPLWLTLTPAPAPCRSVSHPILLAGLHSYFSSHRQLSPRATGGEGGVVIARVSWTSPLYFIF